MIEMLGNSYITDKEASKRYGYSQSWFIKNRLSGKGPRSVQLNNNGRVLYPVEETDRWFKERIEFRQ